MNNVAKLLIIGCISLFMVVNSIGTLDVSLTKRGESNENVAIEVIGKNTEGNTSLNEQYPAMCEPVEIEVLKTRDDYAEIALINYPSEFSWKNYHGMDLTTPARNQGQCGSCWAFAALGSIESLINIKENCADIDIDLAEQYLLSCVPASGSCSGGQSASPFSFIVNTSEEGNYCNGVIFEECLPYQADDDIQCSQKAAYWMETLVPLSGFGEKWFGPNNPSAVDSMKSQIFQNGPIYTLMYVNDDFRLWGSLFHKSENYYRYRDVS